MPAEVEFNLLDEPWIIVLEPDGRERQVSILGAFEQAQQLGTIAGEVPTQAFAITRLLLAFLHRAIDGPQDQDEWEQLWEADELPLEQIREYAQRVRSRFDLFHPETPFFQVARLHTAKNEVSGLEKIVADVPNGEPYFTTRSAASLRCIEAAEAARWLVHVHAFDPSGIKSGAVGDPRVKRGKGYPIGPGWSGQIGGVLPQGRNLRETLLLNLISRDVESYVRIGERDDVPPWERDPDGPEGRERSPRGAIDLYTWQTRRVRLVGDRNGVTGVVLANGDPVQPQNQHIFDPHTVWRYSEPQSKKLKATVYMPQTHDPDRPAWRELPVMLPSIYGRKNQGKTPEEYLAPGVLQWISDLVSEKYLPEDYVLRVRVLGVEYGAQSATYSEIIDDVLPLSVVLLRQDRSAVGPVVKETVSDAEKVGTAIWSLVDNLAQAGGDEFRSGAGDRAREQFYAALETPYRDWLSKLSPSRDPASARAEWQQIVKSTAYSIAEELIKVAPPMAWTGRTIKKARKSIEDEKERTTAEQLVNVALADMWFETALEKTLPFARAHPGISSGGSGMHSSAALGARSVRKLGELGSALDQRVFQLQNKYLAGDSAAKATLAELRRGLGKPVGSVPEILEITVRELPVSLSWAGDGLSTAEQVAHAVFTLYALHQHALPVAAHDPDVSFGKAVRFLRSNWREETVVRRFMAVSTAETIEEMLFHLKGMVVQLRSAQRGFDYARLADDLMDLLNPGQSTQVRLAWGRDFYRTKTDTDINSGSACAAKTATE